jgi:transposase
LPWPVAVAYEAGPIGFGLARQLAAVGVRCVVAAPSKLHRPAADRVKTDARDALHLARLLRMDQIVQVRVASPAQEAARDLVRAREDVRADLMRCRHRLSKLLLRHGILYSGGRAWTGQRFAVAATPGCRLCGPVEPRFDGKVIGDGSHRRHTTPPVSGTAGLGLHLTAPGAGEVDHDEAAIPTRGSDLLVDRSAG